MFKPLRYLLFSLLVLVAMLGYGQAPNIRGVSPNGDGLNDVLTIDGITAHPDNKVTIIDRSGAIVFEAKGYNNLSKVFDGHSSINGRMQQPGTYFYSLDYVANGQAQHKTGYIILKY
jgi:gliding motility-associated-like protein